MLPLWKPAPHKWELFKKNGYPDWWYELQAKKKDSAGADANKGKVAIMSVEPHLSLIPQVESSQDAGPISDIGNCGSNLVTSSYDVDRGAWLLDSGAIDHMTFATTDFTTTSPLRHTSIANANGVVSPVIGVRFVYLSHYRIRYLFHRSHINYYLLVKLQ